MMMDGEPRVGHRFATTKENGTYCIHCGCRRDRVYDVTARKEIWHWFDGECWSKERPECHVV